MRYFLPALLQTITRKPRYMPDIQWDKRIWIANIFRLWELLFGRRYGIRAEASTSVSYENGKLSIKRKFYTLEALLTHIEVTIRGYVFFYKSLFYSLPLNYQTTSVTFVIFGFVISFHAPQHLLPLVGLAIALDTSAKSASGSASPLQWNHTCTGSNLILAVGIDADSLGGQASTSAVTYNSISMTKAKAQQQGGEEEDSIWLLASPATGSNQISATLSFGSLDKQCGGVSISYSGAQSSSTADATGSTNGAATGDKTFTVTTVSDNCWVVAIGGISTNTTGTLTADQTSRQNLTLTGGIGGGAVAGEDTNGVVTPAGAKTMGFTISSSSIRNYSFVGASFAPAAAGTTVKVLGGLMMMGVGN